MRVKLKDITKFSKGTQINGKNLIDDGAYSYLNGGINPSGKWNEFNVSENTVTISEGGNSSGYVNYMNDAFWCGAHCYYLYDGPKNSKYLYYALKSQQERLFRIRSGACMPNIKKSDLGNFIIEYEKDEVRQEEVVKVLEKCELLIEDYNKKLTLLDEAIRARFVEMFGDPIENQKNWQVVKIGDIATDVRYGTSKPAVEGGKYPYLRMNNLTVDGGLDLNNLKYIDIPDNEIEKCVVRKGDILFNRTNSIDLIGKTAVFNLLDDMVIAGYIIRIRLNNQILPDVFSQYMNLEVMKKVLRGMAKGAVNQANINAQELQSIKVYIPNMELQKQYVEFKEEIDKSRLRELLAIKQIKLLLNDSWLLLY